MHTDVLNDLNSAMLTCKPRFVYESMLTLQKVSYYMRNFHANECAKLRLIRRRDIVPPRRVTKPMKY